MNKGKKVGEKRILPGERQNKLIKLRNEYVPKAEFQVAPIFIAKAKGALVEDMDGNEYIDFAGGAGALNTGHCNEEIVSAIREQVGKYLHASFNIWMYEPFVMLAKRLCEITPGGFPKQAQLFNTGAEAVENAVKVARRCSGKYNVIAFEHAFHGRTFLAMALTSQVKYYKYGFGLTDIGIMRVPYAYCYRCSYALNYPDCGMHCVRRIEDMFRTHVAAESIAALVIEPILGEGGYVIPPMEFIKGLRKICDDYDILFIADEIQSGIGRTGKMWAIENFDVVPDLIAAGKSAAGGMVLSATIGRKDLMGSVDIGGLGGTYGGHPVSCVAGLKAIEIIEQEKLLNRAVELGRITVDRLEHMEEQYRIIGDVRGLGSMIGLELVRDRDTKEPATQETGEILRRCHEHGLMIISCGLSHNVIRFLYPLIIEEEELEKGLDILEDAVKETNKML